MKLSLLIKTLTAAKKQFGDVPVFLIDGESGDYDRVKSVMKLHPNTAEHGCCNRAEPPYGVAILQYESFAKDLEVKP